MTLSRLDDALSAARDISPQRWVLGGLAVVAVVVALAATVIGTDQPFGWFVLFIICLAAVSAVQPGWNTGATVIALVVIEWMATVDDVTDGRAVIVASGLFVFHTVLALLAVTPHRAAVDTQVLRAWLLRSAFVVAATGAVWVLVRVLDRRDAVGDARLTMAALVVVGTAAIALRRSAGDA